MTPFSHEKVLEIDASGNVFMDPVYFNTQDYAWYWWDETEAEYGPYATEAAARADLDTYCREMLLGV